MKIEYDSEPIATATNKPAFFETPGLDRLYGMFVALCEQLAVANERHDTLTRVLVQENIISQETLDSYVPPKKVVQDRIKQHQNLVVSILADLESEMEGLKNK